jgi:hypothetical protein
MYRTRGSTMDDGCLLKRVRSASPKRQGDAARCQGAPVFLLTMIACAICW